MDKTELYRRAYALLQNPEAFTTLWWAKTADNRSVMWSDPEAVKFDLMGALLKEAGDDSDACNEAMLELVQFFPSDKDRINNISEKVGHSGVLLLLEKALGLVELPQAQAPVETVAAEEKPRKRGRRKK